MRSSTAKGPRGLGAEGLNLTVREHAVASFLNVETNSPNLHTYQVDHLRIDGKQHAPNLTILALFDNNSNPSCSCLLLNYLNLCWS
mmetsp:Transcript_12232/g.19238  ORF Transcript_12232/g.19238 Transcript_12232/m.19238 type:complete len:86 (-) Transcript_12232:611-868(-)